MLFSIDLARMYTLVSRLAEDRGRDELQGRFEGHVHMQGVAAVEKCGESAQNVCVGGGMGVCICMHACLCAHFSLSVCSTSLSI